MKRKENTNKIMEVVIDLKNFHIFLSELVHLYEGDIDKK